jgi:hypothetical protein
MVGTVVMFRHDPTVTSSGEPNRERPPSDIEIIGQFGGLERELSGERDGVKGDSMENRVNDSAGLLNLLPCIGPEEVEVIREIEDRWIP